MDAGCRLLLGHEAVGMLAMDVTCLTTVAYLLLRNIACDGGSIKARDFGSLFATELMSSAYAKSNGLHIC